jgi:hypothetical protein
VQSIKWGHQVSVKFVNAWQGLEHVRRACDHRAGVAASEQVTPWRYDVKASFQLDTQLFKTYRMRPTVGQSLNEHHMLVIDAAECKKQTSSAPALL